LNLLDSFQSAFKMGTDTRGPQVMANTIAMLTLSTIATALRIYCRAGVIKNFGLDDWLAVIAQV
jgi:hypothetical protein